MKNISTSNLSYKEYMKDQLELLSNNFAIKSYKRANVEKYHTFENGKDIRVQIQWNGDFLYEFLVEKSFWHQRNSNKEDRIYMRGWADPKIEMIKSGLVHKPSSSPRYKSKPKNAGTISSTQDAFEKIKRL